MASVSDVQLIAVTKRFGATVAVDAIDVEKELDGDPVLFTVSLSP